MELMTLMATLNAALLLLAAGLLFRGANATDKNHANEVAVLQSEYQRLADLSRSHARIGSDLGRALHRLQDLETAERRKLGRSEAMATARQLLGDGADNDTVASRTALCRTEVELLASLTPRASGSDENQPT